MLFSEREAPGRGDGSGLSGEEQDLADKVRSLVHGKIDDPLELELYASVWYLAPRGRLSKRDRESIMRTMRRTKPHFAEARVADTLAEIEAFRRKNKAS